MIRNLSVAMLRPGDIWDAGGRDQVQIDAVETIEHGLLRIHGRIVRGHGRSTQARSWTLAPEQTLDIIRSQP